MGWKHYPRELFMKTFYQMIYQVKVSPMKTILASTDGSQQVSITSEYGNHQVSITSELRQIERSSPSARAWRYP